MTKLLNKQLALICLSILFILGISCTSETSQPQVGAPPFPVKRGNLAITVSVDGNLVMPQAFDLSFGAPGTVQDVLVEEGDQVKGGAVLATLDRTLQTLDIQSANNNVQNVLSNLYETVPRLPQFPNKYYDASSETTTSGPVVSTTVQTYFNPPDTLPPVSDTTTTNRTGGGNTLIETATHTVVTHTLGPIAGTTTVTTTVEKTTTTTTIITTERPYRDSRVIYPFYYPNHTALASFVWAQEEVSRAQYLLQANDYTAAASELHVAVSDLEICINIFHDALYSFESGLGPVMQFYGQENMHLLAQYNLSLPIQIESLQNVIELVEQTKVDLEEIQTKISEANYAEADSTLRSISQRMGKINEIVTYNVNSIEKKNNSTIYGRDISLYLYGAIEEKLNAALKGIEAGGLDSPDMNSNLRIAQHYMEICNAILGSNDYVLEHGLSLKSEHQYNIDLENALVNLENKKENFLDTIILAPFDGTVVSVGVKKNDVLSAVDYSSKGTIQLVDTSQVKFEGTVDEIDILRIETGQKATLSVDAIPGKTFTGTVSFISPYGEATTSNVVKFNVTILLDPTDVELKGGLTATADIEVSSIENVLLVPLSAITTSPAGSFVTVIIDEATGKTETRQVTLGMQSLQFAEVVSGLNEGDKIKIQERVIGAPVTQRQFGPPPRDGGPPR